MVFVCFHSGILQDTYRPLLELGIKDSYITAIVIVIVAVVVSVMVVIIIITIIVVIAAMVGKTAQ